MSRNKALNILVPIIFFLALMAALAGVWPGSGSPFEISNFRGEEVTINARGLYYWDTVSSAAQMQANDLVTLVVGLPLLAFSYVLSLRDSTRGKVVLTGTLGFVLYTYITMCFGAAYNQFFLVYVALFSLSLFAFVLSMMSFDLQNLPQQFSEKLPRRWIAGLLFFAAAFLGLAWLGRIAATFSQEVIPALENTTSMFIQAMDLGIIMPTCILSAVLLLRKSAWGYLLASVGMLKFLTLGIAVGVMALNMARVGVPISVIELVVFPAMALVNLVMTIILLRNIQSPTGYPKWKENLR